VLQPTLFVFQSVAMPFTKAKQATGWMKFPPELSRVSEPLLVSCGQEGPQGSTGSTAKAGLCAAKQPVVVSMGVAVPAGVVVAVGIVRGLDMEARLKKSWIWQLGYHPDTTVVYSHWRRAQQPAARRPCTAVHNQREVVAVLIL